MKWDGVKDGILVKEILLFEPWNHKHVYEESGKCWERISESLNNLPDVYFKVTQRSVRDRYNSLEKKFKQKNREEEKASGIIPDESDLDKALRDISERFAESNEEFLILFNEKTKVVEDDAGKAWEMRQESLETFGEIRKRTPSEEESPGSTKRRNTGSETFQFLKEKIDSEKECKSLDLEFRKEELKEKVRLEDLRNEREKEALELQRNQKNITMAMLQQQQQQSQQMMQQQQVMLTVMMEMINKKNN